MRSSAKNMTRTNHSSICNSFKCENCGASFKPFNQYCEYCGSERPYKYPDISNEINYTSFYTTLTGTRAYGYE